MHKTYCSILLSALALTVALPVWAEGPKTKAADKPKEPATLPAPAQQDKTQDINIAPSQSTPPVAATDVVILTDGSMLRGTISEMNPLGNVVLILITGEVRTFPMRQVRYAGPKENAPQPQTHATAPSTEDSAPSSVHPMVTVHGQGARLELTSPDKDVTFHWKTSEAQAFSSRGGAAIASGYERICTAPCEATIPSGHYTMGLSQGNDPVVETDNMVEIPGDSTVEGHYESRRGVRIAGTVIFVAGLTAGTLLILSEDGNRDLGLGLALGSLIGIPLARIGDKAEIIVTPTTAPTSSQDAATARSDKSSVPHVAGGGLGIRSAF